MRQRTIGVPQGSIFGPHCSVDVNDLPSVCEDVDIQMYIVIYMEGKDHEHVAAKLLIAKHKIALWLFVSCLTLNVSKTTTKQSKTQLFVTDMREHITNVDDFR